MIELSFFSSPKYQNLKLRNRLKIVKRKTIGYSILLNRSPYWNSVSQHDLRQGGSLFSYLFLIVVECSSRMILRAKSLNLLNEVKIAWNAFPISHSLYVNNVVIFLRANVNEALTMKQILDQYCHLVKPNDKPSKSTIFFKEYFSPIEKKN